MKFIPLLVMFTNQGVRETSTRYELQPKKFSNQAHGMVALRNKMKCG